MKLVAKVGDHEKAMGICVNAWVVSCEYWRKGRRPIPRQAWLERCLSDALIEVGLARVVEDEAIYVCGSERMHDWYFRRIEASKKGGLKTQEKKRSNTKAKSSKRKQAQPPVPVPVPVPVPGTGTVPESSQGGASAPPPRAEGSSSPPLNSQTWEAYAESYRQRYRTDPVRNATVNGQVAQLVRRLGHEAPDVIRFYLAQNRAFYLQSCHPVGLCLKDAEALRTQWANDQHMLPTEAQQLERRAHNVDVWDRAAARLSEKASGGKT